MSRPETHASLERRLAIAVSGVVQGVGFRPFVYHAARARGLTGWVRNEADTVRIEVQGGAEAVEEFVAALRHAPPSQARIDRMNVREIPARDGPRGEFTIRPSPSQGTPGPTIPADLATCGACLAEIRDPSERRYRYPFTNCTACGPRWSILRQVPYDRARTSMAGFPMCLACDAEYRDPGDRRFHAQPIACPRCGPQLEWLDPVGRTLASRDQALDEAVAALLAGRIVALKGLGGFQLLVDATSGPAVARLRQRKRRPDKPLALMLASLDETRRRCEVGPDETRALVSPQAPIVLLRQRRDAQAMCDVADEVAPGNPYLGVMLPYTPLHHLLMDRLNRPIVCTSGNLSEEPMAISTDEAVGRLGRIADGFLVHNRPIVRPVDDSVAVVGPAGLRILRRARGYAPLPIALDLGGPTVLALGGHLKNTVALAKDSHAVLSAHVGDLDNVPSIEVHQRAAADLLEFFQAEPQVIACDLHPDYASTRHAEAQAARWHVPVVRVQHHHAHVAACMAEYGLQGPVLGFAWDGTGYGDDGTVWGGEVLCCQGATYRRVAHLRTFPLPGGDQATRQPRRSAIGLLHEIYGDQALGIAEAWWARHDLAAVAALLDRPKLCPRTSSLGRLFDAVAALCGLPAHETGRATLSYEGQAAMALEFAADPECADAYPLPLAPGEPAVADWEPLVQAVLADRSAGVPVAIISARFHNALADWAVETARRFAGAFGAKGRAPIVLAGGCFQSALLARRVCQRLGEAGHRVFLPSAIPPGDGGIALGQAYVARAAFRSAEVPPPGAARG